MKLKLLKIATIFAATIVATTRVYAVFAVPNFPSCANPQGGVIASYPDGIHGIPGSTATYTGSDAVYQASDITVLQCFCARSGAGIQTNWWKAASLTDTEIKTLEAQGWIYIPSGTPWGLEDAFYLAQNNSYSCLPQNPPNVGGPGDGLSDGRSDGRSSCPECTAPRGGQVLGISTGDVLGLASTGNIRTVYTVLGLGLVSLLGSAFLFLGRRDR